MIGNKDFLLLYQLYSMPYQILSNRKHFSIEPEFFGRIPIQPDNLPCACYQLVCNCPGNIISFIYEKNISSGSMCLAKFIKGNKFYNAFCLRKFINMLSFIPIFFQPI